MLTIFNRRELITVPSQQKLVSLREALSAAGIPCHVKIRGSAQAAERACRGIPGPRQDGLYTYTISVRWQDYDRARAAIRCPGGISE